MLLNCDISNFFKTSVTTKELNPEYISCPIINKPGSDIIVDVGFTKSDIDINTVIDTLWIDKKGNWPNIELSLFCKEFTDYGPEVGKRIISINLGKIPTGALNLTINSADYTAKKITFNLSASDTIVSRRQIELIDMNECYNDSLYLFAYQKQSENYYECVDTSLSLETKDSSFIYNLPGPNIQYGVKIFCTKYYVSSMDDYFSFFDSDMKRRIIKLKI
jgi:hypothetical protein